MLTISVVSELVIANTAIVFPIVVISLDILTDLGKRREKCYYALTTVKSETLLKKILKFILIFNVCLLGTCKF